jgi:multidrug efflux system outer membrane protein
MNRVIIALVGIAVCAGCAIGPDYERPYIPDPEQFRVQAQKEREIDPTSLAEMPWWELFEDKELHYLIRTALQENKDLMLAAARVEEARGELGVTRSALFPQFGAGASYMYRGIPSALIPGEAGDINLETDIYRIGGQLSWELDVWGQLRRATEASRAELMATEEARRAVILGLISQVAQTYFRLRALDLELEITRRSVKTRQGTLRIVNSRYEDGLVSGLDQARAEAEVYSVSAVIPDLERRIVQTENALSILLGRNPAAVTRGRKLVEQTTPLVIPAGLPSALLERRPDIRQAEQNLVAANAEIGVAMGNFLPRFSLTGDLGVISRDLNQLFTGPSRLWGIGPGVTMPIFTAGRNLGNLEATEAKERQAILQYEQIILQAFQEVEDALIAYKKARLARVQYEKLVMFNDRAVNLSQVQYEEGLIDYLNVLDAQRRLFESEIDLAQTQASQLVSLVQIYKALGGGWTPEVQMEETEEPEKEPNPETASGSLTPPKS